MRFIPIVVFGLLAVALAFALVHKNTPQPQGNSRAEALPALAITTLEGGAPWRPEALHGKVTLINFFASWCTPCAAEMPEFAALKQAFPGLRIEGVVWNDTPAPLQRFLKTHGNPFNELWLDTGGKAGIALGIRGVPETFVVDHQGIIRFRLAAPITPQLRAAELDALLKKLMDEANDEN